MTEGLERITAPQSRALTRRQLMQRMGLSGGGLLALGSSGLLQSGSALAAVAQPTNGIVVVALDLNGRTTTVRSFEGGYARADVASQQAGTDQPINYFVSGYQFEDIVLKIGFDMAPPLFAWINESLGGANSMRSGAFIFSDTQRGEWKRLEFSNAIITEVLLPTCDARLAEQTSSVTIRLSAEATRWTAGSGQLVMGEFGKTVKAPVIFRLNISGLESSTAFVSKIEGWGVKRSLAPDTVGRNTRARSVATTEVLPVKLLLPENRSGPFYSWFETLVVKRVGNVGELTGLLEWLASDMTVIASVQLRNLGIVSYAPQPITSGTNTAPQVMVELYCERLSLSFPP